MVASLVPPLPLPDADKAAQSLAVITEIFQNIAEAIAEQEAASKAEAAAAAARKTKTSLFSFRPAPAPAAAAVVAPTPAPGLGRVDSTPSVSLSTSASTSTSISGEKSGPVSALAAETVDAEAALPLGETLQSMVLQEGENKGQTHEAAAVVVAQWDDQHAQLSADQKPVCLSEGFKYW